MIRWGGVGELPTIKGRPLLTSKFCSPVGTAGDLVCADLSQYIMTWMCYPDTGAGLAFAFEPRADKWHRG